MPVEITWDDQDETIIRVNFIEEWRWVDYDSAVDRVLDMMHDVDYRVDLITDMTTSAPFPSGDATSHVMRFRERSPENFGILVVMNPDHYTRRIIDTANKHTDNKRRSVITDNIQHARQLIAVSRQAQRNKSGQSSSQIAK